MALLKLPDRTVDLDQRLVSGTHDHRLTELEVRVLGHLVEHSDRPVSRDELLVEVWEYQPGVRSRAPDTLMKGLRKKLEPDPKRPVLLLGVYGKGYRWAGPGIVQPARSPWPARMRGFFGRTAAQAELRTHLEQGTPRVAVVGPPGAGTSRLLQQEAPAEAVVLRWRPGWTDDQLLDLLADRLGGPLDPREPRLVVVDDLDPDGHSVVERVLAVPASTDGLRLWVATASPPRWAGVAQVRVGPLEMADALALLDARRDPSSTAGSDAVRRALVTAVAGLPGDLERVATALSTASASEVLDELRTDPEGFWRAMPDDPDPSLPHLWSGLAPPSRRLLQAAATWPAPVRRDHAVAAAGARPATVRTLERAGALAVWRDASGHSRVAVPGRVRAALPEVPVERSAAARAALWAVLAERVVAAVGPEDPELADHVPLLLAAAADPSLDPDLAVDIVWLVYDHLDRAGSYRLTLDLLQLRRPSTEAATFRRQAALAGARVRLNQLDAAEADGLAATGSLEPLVRVRAWSSVGSARAIRGDTRAALPAFEAAAAIAIPPSALRLRMTDNLAAARIQLGDYTGGIAALEANVREARRMGGGARLASILTNLTSARAAAGDTPGALTAGDEALQLHEALHDPRLCAFDHANLAAARSRTSDIPGARRHVDEARALVPRFDDPRLRAWIELAHLLVLCAEQRADDARQALSALLATGGVAQVARGGGELLDALVELTRDPSTAPQAREAMACAPDLHGARLLLPSLEAALARSP